MSDEITKVSPPKAAILIPKIIGKVSEMSTLSEMSEDEFEDFMDEIEYWAQKPAPPEGQEPIAAPPGGHPESASLE